MKKCAEIAANANLKFQLLKNYEEAVLFAKDHPLASKRVLNLSDLLDYPQITHSDRYFLPNQKLGPERSRIYTVDRQGQLTLLKNLPGSYMWSAPVPKELQMECMKAIKAVAVTAPVNAGDVVLANICNTGVDIVATKTVEA